MKKPIAPNDNINKYSGSNSPTNRQVFRINKNAIHIAALSFIDLAKSIIKKSVLITKYTSL